MKLNEINLSTPEGKMLFAALTILTTAPQIIIKGRNISSQRVEPDKMLEAVADLANDIEKDKYKNSEQTKSCSVDDRMEQFEKGLEEGINKLSLENGSNTPDFILAEFLRNVMEVWNKSVMKRSEWYGGRDSILWRDPNQRKLDLSKDFVHAIEQCQDILAGYIVPSSKFTKKYVICEMLRILDDGNLVTKLREYNGVVNQRSCKVERDSIPGYPLNQKK